MDEEQIAQPPKALGPVDDAGPAPYGIDAAALERMVERLGSALSAGDGRGAAECWDVPGLVLGDGGSQAVTSIAEIAAFFEASIPLYREQGVRTVRGEILGALPLSEKVVAVDIRWPGFGDDGAEVWTENSHYMLTLGEDGDYRVRVAASRTL